MQVGIMNSSELGTDCWNPARVTEGECKRVPFCSYAAVKRCKAYCDTRKYQVQVIRVRGNGSREVIKSYITSKPLKEPK